MLKRLDLDLDLQTRYKVTHQKWRPVEPTEKTASTAIMKGDEGRSPLRKSVSCFFLFGSSRNSDDICLTSNKFINRFITINK